MAVRTVGEIVLVVSFSCFPLVEKAVLCCGKDCFMVWKRLFLVMEEAVLRCEKGSFGLRKRLFEAGLGRMVSGCAVYVVGCQRVALNAEKSRICGRGYYVSVLKHSRGVVVGCFFSFLRNDSVFRPLRRCIFVWV